MADSWRRIGRLSYRRRMGLIAVGTAPLSGLCVVYGLQIAYDLVPGSFWVRLAIAAVAAIAFELLVLGIASLFYPGVLVSGDGRRVRIGRNEFAAEALDRFQLDTSGQRDVLSIRLGQHGGPTTRLWLRGPDGTLLDDGELALLLTALDRSAIRPPRSTYDPKNRFTHYNFPGALTKEEAIDLVRHADDVDYRLPLSD